MSKKKKSASTMTLKNFHGGSIPSDLPLPSAPGVSVRPPDPTRGGSTWLPPGHGARSAPTGTRPDPFHHHHHHQQQRNPRGPDPPFLPGFIGRHFDEDERKPFDSSVALRRPLSDPAPSPAPAASRPNPVPWPQAQQQQQQQQQQQRPRSGPGQNAWGIRTKTVLDPAPPAAAKESLAQASAVEKISSGRWFTRQVAAPMLMTPQPSLAAAVDAEVIAVVQLDQRFGESVRVVEDTRGRVYGGGVVRSLDQERGRSRLVDASEAPASEEKQSYQSHADLLHMENAHEMYGSKPVLRPGSAGADSGSRVIERPRLNIKPRSLSVEQLDETIERERKTVFGGARPRELVLKERGIDNTVTTTPEVTLTANRFKYDTSKTEMKAEPAAPITQHGDNGKNLERKEHRADLEKSERSSWRNDNRRRNGEIEKPVERCQEPDAWHKLVVEQPKPEAPLLGPRYRKAASALELAQAFSRSTSSRSRPDNCVPSRKSLPFSRLTDTREIHSRVGPIQRQINGY